MRSLTIALALALGFSGLVAHAQDSETIQQNSNIRLRVTIKADTPPSYKTSKAKVVIGISPGYAERQDVTLYNGVLARSLEDNPRIQTVSPTSISGAGGYPKALSLDDVTNSERRRFSAIACKAQRLDLLVLHGTPANLSKSSLGAALVGIGRTGSTSQNKISVIDCGTLEPVLNMTSTLELSFHAGLTDVDYVTLNRGAAAIEARKILQNLGF